MTRARTHIPGGSRTLCGRRISTNGADAPCAWTPRCVDARSTAQVDGATCLACRGAFTSRGADPRVLRPHLTHEEFRRALKIAARYRGINDVGADRLLRWATRRVAP